MKEQRLESKVAGGVVWSFSEKFLTMVIQMAVSIIVARQLMPDDFGIMAIMTFFTSVALTIVDSGFSQTLIRKASPTDEEYRSVLYFNIVVSIILYLLFISVARPVAMLYDAPAIATIAPVLFLVLPINAFCVVQTVMFTREFRFALLSKIVFLASLISGVVAVVMALMGCGIWSLVAQRLLMMGIKAIAFWSIRRWRSDARFSLAALRGMAPFSLRLLATDLIASVYNNVAQLFIGKMHTTTALGYFSQAQKLKDLPVTSTMQAVQGVTYPALSKLADDDVRFTEGYRRILMLTAYLIFPVMAGLIAIAPDMFMLLLGDKWMPTVPYFEILALAGLVYPLSVVSYNILKVRSDGRVILRLEVIKRIIMTLILLYTIPRGVEAVAWGTSAMALIDFVINAAAAMRYTTLTAVALLRTLAMPLLLSALLYLGVVYLNSHLVDFTTPLRLCLSIAAGVAIYVSGSLIFRPEAFGEAIKLVQSFRNK